MTYKRRIGRVCICLLLFVTVFATGCIPKKIQESSAKVEDQKDEKKKDEDKKDEDKKDEKKKDDDKVIVAGSVDTSSKFTFTVEKAIVGIQEYNEVPVVVLAATFTNNSDEEISFSWALQATAKQGGFTLNETSLMGASDYNYNDIAPGNTVPVFIGWEMADVESDITLTVTDQQHYAKKEIFSQTFTINELIENTKNFQESGEVFDEPLEV